MQTIALIGLLGGLITGISPCILPVLPVVLLSGVNSTRDSTSAARPYLVIAGLVCSFSVVTLAGSALLSALHLPQDAIRWAALVTFMIGVPFAAHYLLEAPMIAIGRTLANRWTTACARFRVLQQARPQLAE